MKGKTMVATGATSGIGEVAALALARMGARIVVVARDEKRAEALLNKLETQAPGSATARILPTSPAWRTRAAWARRSPKASRASMCLINNAGAVFSQRRVTPEGLELTFALNHMAYFVLTAELRDRLATSAPARIVSTSSMAHQGVLDFSDLQSAKGYNGWKAYGRSKLANILFTRELARRLAGTGSPPIACIRAWSRRALATLREAGLSRLDAAGEDVRHLARAGRGYDHPPRLVA